MKTYSELTVTTTHEGAELVSDIFWNYSDLGVVILDAQDALDLLKSGKNWDYADNDVFSGGKTVFVKAYFPEEDVDNQTLAEREIAALKTRAVIDVGTLETVKRTVDGDLWREKWKEHFKPLHIDRVVVVPEWIDYKENAGEVKILLDSNMAFGTGEHETTSMCVSYLSEEVKKNMTVLDVGCGSGILGITASKLGAKRVIFTDIDECAVKATEHNLKLNGVSGGEVYLKNLLDDESIKGDLITANIVADVLVAFSDKVGKNLTGGGRIILSGILNEYAEKVKTAYLNNGFKFISEKKKGEWTAMLMERI